MLAQLTSLVLEAVLKQAKLSLDSIFKIFLRQKFFLAKKVFIFEKFPKGKSVYIFFSFKIF